MSPQRTQANLSVEGFSVSSGEDSTRLDFPRATLAELRGKAGHVEYLATSLVFDELKGRIGPMHWTCDAASSKTLVVRGPGGQYELAVGHIDLPRGLQMTRAAGGGIELVAPEATLSDVHLHLPDLQALRGPPPEDAPAPEPPEAPEPQALRQERLHFLDAVTGSLAFRVKVDLDLPVIGQRTLDQPVRVDIRDGSFDYRALDDGLDWLEGQFLDLGVTNGRFTVGWSVPLLKSREIISWALAPDAAAMAVFNRIPLRALADLRVGGPSEPRSAEARSEGKRRLRSMTLAGIDIKLSMVAPRSVEIGGGAILFGGENAPGIVDLQVEGALIHPPAPGAILGKIGALDLTLKDVALGGAVTTVDRLHIDDFEELVVTFDGFTPTSVGLTVKRVTATNLVLVLK